MDENASQSILMVGGMLLAIALLSFFVYAIATFGGFARDMNAQIEGSEIQKFNQHFYQYDGRFNLTIQDVVTAINFAKDWNDKNNYTYNQVVNQSVEFFANVKINGNYVFGNMIREDEYNSNQKFKSWINDELLNVSHYSDYFYAVNVINVSNLEEPGTTYTEKDPVVLNGEYKTGNDTDIKIDTRTGFVYEISFTVVNSSNYSKLPKIKINGSYTDVIEYTVKNKDHFRMTEIR